MSATISEALAQAEAKAAARAARVATKAPPPLPSTARTAASGAMSYSHARQLLHDVSQLSPAQIDEAEAVLAAHQNARPRNATCPDCRSMVWEADTGGPEPRWVCGACKRPRLHEGEWAKRQSKAAPSPMAQPVPPREALAAAIQARTEAQKAVADLEAGLTAARTLLATAQAARNEAAAAEQTAKASAATYLARSFLNRAQDGPEPSQAAARAALAAAEDRFDAVGTARGELEMQLISAKQSHGIATERARNAAASVLGAELGGHLVERATAARDDFVAAVHGLSWLGRQHVPLDAAAARLIASLEMRPSQWPSPPPSTDWPALMATLLNDAKAAIGPP